MHIIPFDSFFGWHSTYPVNVCLGNVFLRVTDLFDLLANASVLLVTKLVI